MAFGKDEVCEEQVVATLTPLQHDSLPQHSDFENECCRDTVGTVGLYPFLLLPCSSSRPA